jgi:tetratricopeptide (TPR) repeat protein
MFHLYRCTREDLIEARELFRQATAIDPELGPAYSAEAEAYYYEVVYGFARSNQENREKAIGPARRAVTLDAEDAGAHCTLGRIRYLRREYPPAISELETALELNPSLALAHYGLGAALVFSGRAADAVPHLESAIRLSPHDPNMGSFLVRIADARYFLGDYEGATAFALKALGQPNFQWSRYAVLIAALGQLGRHGEARRYLDEVTHERPDFSPAFSIAFVRNTHLFGEQDIMDRFCEGLRKAAVPEAT